MTKLRVPDLIVEAALAAILIATWLATDSLGMERAGDVATVVTIFGLVYIVGVGARRAAKAEDERRRARTPDHQPQKRHTSRMNVTGKMAEVVAGPGHHLRDPPAL